MWLFVEESLFVTESKNQNLSSIGPRRKISPRISSFGCFQKYKKIFQKPLRSFRWISNQKILSWNFFCFFLFLSRKFSSAPLIFCLISSSALKQKLKLKRYFEWFHFTQSFKSWDGVLGHRGCVRAPHPAASDSNLDKILPGLYKS